MPESGGNPLVTVVMPSYNAVEYLDEAIASVLLQSVGAVELLVVDDGSTDATRERAESWALRDPRVRVLHQQNRGVSAARNVALANGAGRFFALLDSDDVWAPEFLAVQLDVLQRMPRVGVVTGNAWERGGPNDGAPLRPRSAMLRHLHLRDLIEDETAVCIMSVFRREVVEAIGGFDERLRHSEDYEFWIRTACAGFGIVQTPEPLAWYRRRADGASTNETAMLDGIRQVLTRTREQCAGQVEMVSLIDRQLRRFTRERLVLQGKAALLAGAFGEAAEAFRQAAHLDGSPRMRAVALACRVAPRSLRAVYNRRASMVRLASA